MTPAGTSPVLPDESRAVNAHDGILNLANAHTVNTRLQLSENFHAGSYDSGESSLAFAAPSKHNQLKQEEPEVFDAGITRVASKELQQADRAAVVGEDAAPILQMPPLPDVDLQSRTIPRYRDGGTKLDPTEFRDSQPTGLNVTEPVSSTDIRASDMPADDLSPQSKEKSARNARRVHGANDKLRDDRMQSPDSEVSIGRDHLTPATNTKQNSHPTFGQTSSRRSFKRTHTPRTKDLVQQTTDSLSESESESESDLSSLPEEEPLHPESDRPKESFNTLIIAAIESSADGQLDGRAIVEWIKERHHFYREIFDQKRLYSNVHALLSMGKKHGKYVKHEPTSDSPNRKRGRSKYSLPATSTPRMVTHDRNAPVVEKPGQLQVPETRSNRSSAARRLVSPSPSPSSHSRQNEQDADMRSLPLGDVGYRVRNHASSAYRIVPKIGLPEWETLQKLDHVNNDEEQLVIGDMVKILTESPDDEFGIIFDMREVAEDRIAVAVLWYRSHKDLAQVLSHKSRREWPDGYKYMLSNEVDVINLKAIDRKADAVERRSVFPGPKVWDCSGRSHLIRECTSKEVAWALTLVYPNMNGISDSTPDNPSRDFEKGSINDDSHERISDLSDHPVTEQGETTKIKRSILGKRRRNQSTPLIRVEDNASEVENHHETPLAAAESRAGIDQSLVGSPTTKLAQSLKKRKITSADTLDISPKGHYTPDEISGLYKQSMGERNTSINTSDKFDQMSDHSRNTKAARFARALGLKDVDEGFDDLMDDWKQGLSDKGDKNTMLRALIHELITHNDVKDSSPKGDNMVEHNHVATREPQMQQAGARVANMRRQQPTDPVTSGVKRSKTRHSETPGDPVRSLLDQLRAESRQLRSVPEQLRAESLDRDLEIRLLKEVQEQQEAEIRALRIDVGKTSRNLSHLRAAVNHRERQVQDERIVPDHLLFNMTLNELDDPENRFSTDIQRAPISVDAVHLKSQKKKMFGKVLPREEKKPVKYGETPCPELRAILNIPEGHVICSHRGSLAYRDDTRVSTLFMDARFDVEF